jgi:hypothetical protein
VAVYGGVLGGCCLGLCVGFEVLFLKWDDVLGLRRVVAMCTVIMCLVLVVRICYYVS